MTALLDLHDAPASRVWDPLPTAPATDGERFALSLEAQLATGNFASQERNLRQTFDDAAAALREAGAAALNPYEAGEFQGAFLNDIGSLARRVAGGPAGAVVAAAGAEERRRREDAWDRDVYRLREAQPDQAERYLTAAEIRAMAERRARNAADAARAPEDMGGGLGAFAGQVAGIFSDPAQVLTLPLGAGRMSGTILSQVLRTAGIEALVAGGTQAVVEARAGAYRQDLGLPDDSLGQIAMAAAGGAIIGGGLRGLIAGAERLLARGGQVEPEILAAARAEAAAAAARPGLPEQAAAHDAAMAQATRDLLAGDAPTASVPPARPDPPRTPADAAPLVRATEPAEPTEPPRLMGEAGPRLMPVYTPAGREIVVEPRLVELDRLVPSHDADGRLNPAYPHAEGVQPRDRSAAPSLEQVRRIVAEWQPRRLMPNAEAGAGAPIVNPADLVVESGNGRVMALQRVFRDPDLASRRDAYLAALREAGFDPAGLREPVLVSARVTPLSPAERSAFVREANGRLAAAETMGEQAARDAEAVGRLMEFWRGGAVGAAANRDFLRRFVDRLGAEDLPELIARDGTPLPALVQRVERSLLTAAYGEALGPLLPRLLSGQTEGFRAIAGALRNVAGDWAALRQEIRLGRVPADQEATPALAEAVGAIVEAQQRGLRLEDFALQQAFDRAPMTGNGLAMLRAMFPEGDLGRRMKGEQRLTDLLAGFLDRARAAVGGPMLLDLPPVRAADTLAAAGRAEDLRGEASGLVEAADPQVARLREADATARRLAAAPETQAAELLEAQRVLAAADVRVPSDTGQISGRDLLDAASDDARDAAAAAACLIGGGAA